MSETRVLIVETASPKRLRRTVEEVLRGEIYPEPRVTILCSNDKKTADYLSSIPGVEVIPFDPDWRREILAGLRAREFEVLRVFWTGEKKYRKMKRVALRLGIRPVDVEIGDGSAFRLHWKSFLRFAQFRAAHPLPTDHYTFVEPETSQAPLEYYEGEKVLIIQSAGPGAVLRGLDRLQERRLFREPRYSLFCRDTPEIVESFRNHPMLSEVRTHRETRGAWRLLKSLRRERFDGVVVFFTGDPSYWKIKYFAFLLGARHKLIFNENNDCFFFSWGDWLSLLSHRLGERSRHGGSPRWVHRLQSLFFVAIKLLLFPFRLAWLLLVWLRLRLAS